MRLRFRYQELSGRHDETRRKDRNVRFPFFFFFLLLQADRGVGVQGHADKPDRGYEWTTGLCGFLAE